MHGLLGPPAGLAEDRTGMGGGPLHSPAPNLSHGHSLLPWSLGDVGHGGAAASPSHVQAGATLLGKEERASAAAAASRDFLCVARDQLMKEFIKNQ